MLTLKLFARYILTGIILFQIPDLISAQASPPRQSIFEHLSQIECAKMTLEIDMTTLVANKKKNDYMPGTLTTEDGKVYQIEAKPRGKYRRKVSEIPPLKIKFKKKGLVADGLDTLNEIKITLPTVDNAEGDELIVKEYLAYRMFEKITPASVRARLIKLTIRDSHVEKSKKTMYAILVEDEEEITARLKGTAVDQYGIDPDSIMQNQAGLVVMFEFMIGNTDWEIAMQRNVRLIRSPESGKVLVVPYDFDFSGFVSAPYATPSSESGLKTVRDRFLMSNGIKPDALKKGTQIIKAAKKDIYDICKSKYVSRTTSLNMTYYLDTFFQFIDAKDEVPTTLLMPTE